MHEFEWVGDHVVSVNVRKRREGYHSAKGARYVWHVERWDIQVMENGRLVTVEAGRTRCPQDSKATKREAVEYGLALARRHLPEDAEVST